jgi:GNAT superfamily N-acetyltransferase
MPEIQRVVTLTGLDGDLIERVSALYAEALPRSERKAAAFLTEAAHRSDYVLQAMLCETRVVGFAATYRSKRERIALLEYLAVNAADRRQGLGSRLLHAVQDVCGDRAILIEVDRPSGSAVQSADAENRCRFYRRGGWLCVSPLVYYMPPVGPEGPPPMSLMIRGIAHDTLPLATLKTWLLDIYRNVYKVDDAEAFMKNVTRSCPHTLAVD